MLNYYITTDIEYPRNPVRNPNDIIKIIKSVHDLFIIEKYDHEMNAIIRGDNIHDAI